MSVSGKIVIAVLVISYLTAFIALVIGAGAEGRIAAAPALVLSGWGLFGHLITLDDDIPGEWSNPEGSKKVWRNSLVELLVKLLLFVAALYLFVALSDS